MKRSLLDKFMDVLENFINCVRKHCGTFFWLCWIYYFALIILQIVFELSETVIAVMAIPMNLFTWPVFLEAHKAKEFPILVQRMVWGLPFISTLLPLLLLLDL